MFSNDDNIHILVNQDRIVVTQDCRERGFKRNDQPPIVSPSHLDSTRIWNVVYTCNMGHIIISGCVFWKEKLVFFWSCRNISGLVSLQIQPSSCVLELTLKQNKRKMWNDYCLCGQGHLSRQLTMLSLYNHLYQSIWWALH